MPNPYSLLKVILKIIKVTGDTEIYQEDGWYLQTHRYGKLLSLPYRERIINPNRLSSYLSCSPTGFILKGDGLAESGGLISVVHCPWGSTTTFSTLWVCSGWTILFAVLYSDGVLCRGTEERCISCFLFLSCLTENCIFSFTRYKTYS